MHVVRGALVSAYEPWVATSWGDVLKIARLICLAGEPGEQNLIGWRTPLEVWKGQRAVRLPQSNCPLASALSSHSISSSFSLLLALYYFLAVFVPANTNTSNVFLPCSRPLDGIVLSLSFTHTPYCTFPVLSLSVAYQTILSSPLAQS